MPSYTLQIEAFGVFTNDIPSLEILADGAVESTLSVLSDGVSTTLTINFSGTLPSSLSFRFNDGLSETGRTIEIQSVTVNNRTINTGNFLSSDSLTQGQSAIVNIPDAGFIFDSSEPAASEFTTGATQTFTTGGNNFFDRAGTADEVFDMLAGRDVAFLGSGDDKVNGNAGNDYIRGGGGNDLIFGGADNDLLMGQDGNDQVYGGDGNDSLYGHDGEDELHGGAGNDRLSGHDDDDILTGGAGEDRLNGGAGNDFLYGDGDDDQLVGGAGDDTLDGGLGDDLLYGGFGDDILDGSGGEDVLVGQAGNDTLNGGDNNDRLHGQTGNDTLNGGDGDDLVFGGDGTDTLRGGAGTDVLTGGAGADVMEGGDGNDTLHGHGLNAAQIRTILSANAGVVFNAETNSFYQYVSAPVTWTAARTAAQASTINGVAGHLVNITSQFENDFITNTLRTSGPEYAWIGANDVDVEGDWRWIDGAEAGFHFWQGTNAGSPVNNAYDNWRSADPDSGTAENHALHNRFSSEWHNVSVNNSVGDSYVIEWDAGLISDDLAVDTIDGGAGNDFIYGYGGDDVLSGGLNNDTIFGGDDNDTINGDDGNDSLYGGAGNDTLNGGAGADTIDGGLGDDIINGGLNNDTAIYTSATGNVTASLNENHALDFAGGNDTVNLTGLGLNTASGSRVTVEFWMEWDGTDNVMPFGFNLYDLWFNNGFFGFNNSAGLVYGVSSAGLANTPVHIAAVFEDNNILGSTLYINGVEQSLSILQGSVNNGNAQITDNAQISGWGITTGFKFDGTIDDLRIWNDERSESEINEYMNETIITGMPDLVASYTFENITTGAGGVTDESGNGNDGTLSGINLSNQILWDGSAVSSGSASGGGGNDTIVNVENLTGSDFDDTLSGNNNANIITGGAGDDVIIGGVQQAVPVDINLLTPYAGSQDASGTVTQLDDNVGFVLDGNRWKDLPGSYVITANTVLEFDFKSTVEPEVAAIGFDTNETISQERFFKLYGTQSASTINNFENYDGSGNWVHYEINVGTFYTGTFNRLVFESDDDGGGVDGNSWWRNIVLHEGAGGNNTLTGDVGVDELYGDSGLDTFLFEETASVDIIHYFNTQDGDALDISNILTNYVSGTSDIDDYVNFTNSGDHVLMSVDVNGTTGGASFVNIAELRGQQNLDEATLLASGNIVV